MSNNTSSSMVRAPIRIGTALSTELQRRAIAGVRAVAFWAAIVLPIAYLPAAYGAMGFDGAWSTIALITAHIVCAVIGHEHNASAARQ